MGGTPVLALNVALFPRDVEIDKLGEIIRGCALSAIENDVLIAGGHTAKNNDVKYGLSVFGTVAKDKIRLSDRAKPGQAIILTKPLGTGILYAGKAKYSQEFEKAVSWMVKLSMHRRFFQKLASIARQMLQDMVLLFHFWKWRNHLDVKCTLKYQKYQSWRVSLKPPSILHALFLHKTWT